MDFTEQKNQIVAKMIRGDKKAIAKRAGLSVVTVWSAFCKSELNDMTLSEKKAWVAAVDFINNRLNSDEKIEQRTAQVAERI